MGQQESLVVFNWFYLNWDLAILCVDHPQNFMTELRDDDSEKKKKH